MKTSILFFILISFSLYSQSNKQIQIVDEFEFEVDNAKIYSNNILIGETNFEGILYFDNDFQYDIVILKFGYEEKIIPIKDIKPIIKIKKLIPYQLNNVVATPLNYKTILDSIFFKTKSNDIYKPLKNISIYNLLTANKDTLHYLNNNLFWKPKLGRFIENKHGIVKKFRSSDDDRFVQNIYSYKNEEFVFNQNYAGRINSMRYLQSLVSIIENENNYNFELKKKSDTLLILFKPKNKNGIYSGKILLNVSDYGIYEFESELSKPYNTKSYYNGKNKQLFIVEKEYVIMNYNRDDEGNYSLKFSNYTTTLTGKNKAFENVVFNNTYYLKTIEHINIENSTKFNLNNYE